MRLSLVCVLFDPAIPTSFFNFIQLFLYLYIRGLALINFKASSLGIDHRIDCLMFHGRLILKAWY